jgi:hypothetical protein
MALGTQMRPQTDNRMNSRAPVSSIVTWRSRRERNRKTAIVLIGVMIFLMMVSVVTILVKN